MKLIVGLGNPGLKYEGTRHNLGFIVLDQFLKNYQPIEKTVFAFQPKLKSEISELNWQPQDEKIILAKPKTYMNNSGLAVQLLTTYYKPLTTNVWVIHDELDLPLGTMKIRFGGSSAGHNGIESIIAALGTDKFFRFRLGIGRSHGHAFIGKHMIDKADEYVLDKFSGGEAKRIRALVKRGAEALETALEKGLEAAMNRYNTK